MKLPSWLGRAAAYFDNDDARLAAAGSVALIIVGNQPFYPLYVYAIAGGKAWPALLTWFTAPAFAAVPALSRRSSLSGKLLLVGASIGNTALTAMALGTATWVELFYLPCFALAPLLFRGRQTAIGYSVCILGIGAGLGVARTGPGAGLVRLDDEQLHSLARLHGLSVACLLAVFLFLAFKIRRREGR